MQKEGLVIGDAIGPATRLHYARGASPPNLQCRNVAACNRLRYISLVIESFRHKGLRKFFESGDLRGIPAQHKNRIRRQLDVLDAAREVTDMNLPGWRLHQLKGSRKETWAVDVSGNLRLIFHFGDADAYDVDLEDYH